MRVSATGNCRRRVKEYEREKREIYTGMDRLNLGEERVQTDRPDEVKFRAHAKLQLASVLISATTS